MIVLLFIALGLTGLTVVIHALGTLEVIAHLSRHWGPQRAKARRGLASEIQIARVVGVLLFMHLIEAGIWAGMYRLAQLFPDWETAVYFSITSYTTVGYGDVVLPVTWRILGPMEGAVGILMFGWSTGVMVAAINIVYGSRLRIQSDVDG